ncbi:MAG: amidophosphoribosyltransferase [Candidatus Gygaella obscura]|nr:amidophosphoribosyltransferase [Candidatus Gygaella obscura]
MSGVFGVASKGECAKTLFYGVDYHSHMGSEYGGLAVLGKDFSRRIHDITQGQFKSKFFDDYKMMHGDKGIGVISDHDEQPIYIHSKFGEFCIVTVGIIENKEELARDLFKKGISLSEVTGSGINSTELVAKIITQSDNLIDGIQNMFDVIDGSCSLLLLNEEGIYVARDKFGYTPLVIGKKADAWAVASETSAFTNLNFEVTKFVAPGEIVLINNQGMIAKHEAFEKSQICTFLWIYTGFPASSYEDLNVEIVRERCGRALAKKDKDIEADMVCGIPDSGIAHALGYAMESGVVYRRPLVKYTPGYGRSYTPSTQDTRDLIATMKLIPVKEIIKDNKIVICEDSIVRGTQLKNFTVKKLHAAGAKEVHVRAACPPLMFPCKFCLSTRSINELVARKAIKSLEGKQIDDVSEYLDFKSDKYKKMVEWIRKDLEVTTLRFQTIDDMIQAIGIPKEKLCLYCWNGECPKKNFNKISEKKVSD